MKRFIIFCLFIMTLLVIINVHIRNTPPKYHEEVYNVSITKNSIRYDCRIISKGLSEESCIIYLEYALKDSALTELELIHRFNDSTYVMSQYAILQNVVTFDNRYGKDRY